MKRLALLALLLTTSTGALAAQIGTLVPAEPITIERISTLPQGQQQAWRDYLLLSASVLAKDQATLAAELTPGVAPPPPTRQGKGAASMPLDKPADWYAGAEARHIADVIVSFQIPSGGWGKNMPRDGAIRAPGQHYVLDDGGTIDPAKPAERKWHYVGTIDNDATVTEIRFLAKVISQLSAPDSAPYRASVLKGIAYLLAAQMPNGGWPQVFPLAGEYHDAITFNDDAFVHVAQVLLEVAAGAGPFGFVPLDVRAKAVDASVRAVNCILATQVIQNGKRIAWGQQHDSLTLAPTGARNFEPASLSSAESAKIIEFLMGLQSPTDEVKAAIRGGVEWLKSTVIQDREWVKVGDDKKLVTSPGARPIWSRYYSLDSNRPIFGDRDKTIRDDVADLSLERRNGYAWYNNGPEKVLVQYEKWEKVN